MLRAMNPPRFLRHLLGGLLAAILPLVASAQDRDAANATDADRTLSPYFHVKSLDADGEALPLKSTQVDVLVAGVIADVTVTQTYANIGAVPLEALYVFPGSTRAAIHGLTMTVGDRRVRAQIQRRAEARATYETARAEGRTASLLEQQRPNVFQMAVANILPGDTVEVELRYTELLLPTDGAYEFVYPGVVGPRYSNQPAATAPADTRWVANPYLPAGTPDRAAFALSLRLAAGLPIQDASSRTHSVRIDYVSASEARLVLDPTETNAANRDFILRYRLAGNAVHAGLLLSDAPDARGDHYFLAMVQPPARPTPADLPPRDYVFVVDVSGSMHGFPLETGRSLMRRLLPALRPQDTFNILLFSGDSRVLSETPQPATPANINAALALLGRGSGGGGTELLPALDRALNLPRPAENTSRSIVILTDGYVHVEAEAFALIRQNLGRGNVFAFGIGSSVNRHLIESLARAGQGEPFIVTDPGAGETEAARFAAMIASPVLSGVSARFDGLKVSDIEPASLPDVFAQRPVVLFGKWHGAKTGALHVTGQTGSARARDFAARLDTATAATVPVDTLARLWARARIATLSDDISVGRDPDLIEAVTLLGLRHELLTAYTSFVAVDEVVRRTTPVLETVKQPLPLPQGVSNHAVGGGSIPTSPEPGAIGLLGVAALVFGWMTLRRQRRA